MPNGRPSPVATIAIREHVDALYALHRQADDRELASFPAPEDILGVLDFAARRYVALSANADRERSTRLQLALVRHLHATLDRREERIIRLARTVRTPGGRHVLTWDQLAPMLGLDSRNGAMQRFQRLTVATDMEPDELRAPETFRQRKRLQQAADARHNDVCRAADELVQLAEAGAIRTTEELMDDLREIRELSSVAVPTQKQRGGLAARLRLALTELTTLADLTGSPAAATPRARAVLERVAELTTT